METFYIGEGEVAQAEPRWTPGPGRWVAALAQCGLRNPGPVPQHSGSQGPWWSFPSRGQGGLRLLALPCHSLASVSPVKVGCSCMRGRLVQKHPRSPPPCPL